MALQVNLIMKSQSCQLYIFYVLCLFTTNITQNLQKFSKTGDRNGNLLLGTIYALHSSLNGINYTS